MPKPAAYKVIEGATMQALQNELTYLGKEGWEPILMNTVSAAGAIVTRVVLQHEPITEERPYRQINI